jgi:hypothetical protein
MMGLKCMNSLNINLNKAKDVTKEVEQLFGNITIMFSGDFLQLTPVKDKPVYMKTKHEIISKNFVKPNVYSQNDLNLKAGRLCWLSIDNCVFLRKQMRQIGDPEYNSLLSR